MEYVDFNKLEGKTLTRIVKDGNEEIRFHTTSGEVYRMFHQRDCCESVEIEDIDGDLDDLVGNPIFLAEEVTRSGDEDDSSWSSTWTFYKLANIKGAVTIRWFGESNGYYSESVDFVREDD